MPTLAIVSIALGVVLVTGAALWFLVLVPWGTRWGATKAEVERTMTGDSWLDEPAGPLSRVPMTRAISIAAPAERVWPWVAQLGRGAGFYSYDRLDNGGKVSARRVVSWIPDPRLGDATAIGYLRHIEPGRELAWWLSEDPFLGAATSLAFCLRIEPEAGGTRVVFRVSGGLRGWTAPFLRNLFILIDTFMMIRQLKSLRERVLADLAGEAARHESEVGERDQYQLYEVIFADGSRGGVAGKENGARWRERAMRELGDRMGTTPSRSS